MVIITKEWLEEQHACKEGIEWLDKQKNKEIETVKSNLFREKRYNYLFWLLYRKDKLTKSMVWFLIFLSYSLDILSIYFSLNLQSNLAGVAGVAGVAGATAVAVAAVMAVMAGVAGAAGVAVVAFAAVMAVAAVAAGAAIVAGVASMLIATRIEKALTKKEARLNGEK